MMADYLDIRSLLRVSLACVSLCGCSDAPQAEKLAQPKNETPIVLTVNYPIQYFAERIAGSLLGERLKIKLPVDRDVDPAFWKPSSAAISEFQKADLILLNGATYAKWTEIASLPEEKMIDTSASFKNRYIEIEEAFVHQHGPEGEHSHAGTAFTTWLDFQQAKIQASAIRDALVKLLPDQQEALQSNFETLAADLDSLDQQMLAACKKHESKPIVTSLPIYQYFARRYKMNTKSLQWESEMKIAETDLNDLKKILGHSSGQVDDLGCRSGRNKPKTVAGKTGSALHHHFALFQFRRERLVVGDETEHQKFIQLNLQVISRLITFEAMRCLLLLWGFP